VTSHPQRRFLGGVSVGIKLFAATLTVVVLVAVAVDEGSSHGGRRGQVQATEAAAVMAMQRFAEIWRSAPDANSCDGST
jgi:hypothetical protein